jgi:deazaflavin-dependent oxidoreductase (nitroreductase family)
MFDPTADLGHKAMRVVFTLTRHVPREVWPEEASGQWGVWVPWSDGRTAVAVPAAAALANRGLAIAASAGLGPTRLVALEVRGRRTGRVRSFPVEVADYEGERYLVAMLGQDTNWVRNVRATKGRVALRHRRREAVHLEAVDPVARAPILRRYLPVAPGARPHIPVDRRAPLAQFEEIAEQYPVFRVRADSLPHEWQSLLGS